MRKIKVTGRGGKEFPWWFHVVAAPIMAIGYITDKTVFFYDKATRKTWKKGYAAAHRLHVTNDYSLQIIMSNCRSPHGTEWNLYEQGFMAYVDEHNL